MTMRNRNGQDGVAMITVMMIVVVLTLVMVASVNYAIQSEPPSRRDQDWNAALAAAQAGIDDYLYRLQQDDEYVQYSSTNPPTPANVAFTGWLSIPGAANEGQFHYSATNVASQGIIQVVSTGRVRGVQRTIRATMRRRGFLDYLYLTDYESLDPQSGYYSDPATAASRCSDYWWAGRSTSYCVRISFVTGDTINGPLHSNDTLSINGSPRFNGNASTAYTGQMNCTASPTYTWRWYGLSGCSDTPQFRSGDPEAVPILALPTTNTAIKAETDRAAGKTGCLYNGPTRIVLNSSGTMTVTSPFTTATAYAGCVGTNVPLPTNGVIYVQNVPTSQTATCTGSQNRLGYPISNDVTDYGCRDGDAFLSGTLRGRLTIATENNVVIVANTTYATTGAAATDMLGLVANQFVQVYHPVNSSGTNLSDTRNPTNTFTSPQIHAAILALGHSFIVQNYNEGAQLGTITVNGGIAQRWRGPVGTSGGTGYLKNYGYDSRLQFASPPYVQDIADTPYRINQSGEIQNPTGLPA
jgi:Tfp pilus assembly protein PilX